ncbi:cellulose binding domain-containing protein [Cellvibrio sp. OA-2007]|uniref:cellulose binding domain-containing protein n=1 Tax=Cellvibrio sp. OA-2007 TaxID=529823 RepID=UPI0007803207|nr:cellulose binding domain-containing protein [Cellvibrio sp. OA-2007]
MNSSFSLAKKTLALASIGMLSIPAAADWIANGGVLLDPNRQPFVFRGITVNHSLAPERTVQAIKYAGAAGANAVQIEFAAGVYGNGSDLNGVQLRAIVQACKESKTVCVLEPNDVAGYPNAMGSKSPTDIVGYYYQSDIRSALIGQEDYIMLGLGNQALGEMSGNLEYVFRMQTYIRYFIDYFPRFVLVVDGNTWGQDPTKGMHELVEYMRPYGSSGQKIIYSVEMFDAYTDPQKMRDYVASFSQLGAPLVIGGFAPAPYYHPHYSVPLPTIPVQLPASNVMQIAQEYGVGYFAWSWSGNENSALDMVTNWNPQELTAWGNLAINDVNGIKATAKPASIFNNSSSSSSVPANQPPVAAITYNFETVRCGSWYGNVSASGSFDPDGDPLTYQWEISGYGGPITSTEPSVRFYMQPPHSYAIKLTVSDGRGGVTSTSIVRNHTNSDNCIGSSSSSSIIPSSSSVPSVVSSSSSRPSSVSSSSRSSSSAMAAGNCTYVINSQWNNGFTAAVRIKNTGSQPINGWNVNWQYSDGSRITNLWNASLSGSNPYSAKNLSWNSTIQPGQTIEFGFQGSKGAGAAPIPAVTGSVCQ